MSPGPSRVIPGVKKNNKPCYCYVFDYATRMKLIVDTGCMVSVIPKRDGDIPDDFPNKIVAINGTQVTTYGDVTLLLDLGLGKKFPWTFTKADIELPYIGNDFFLHNKVNILYEPLSLQYPLTGKQVPLTKSSHSNLLIGGCDIDLPYAVQEVISKYPTLYEKSKATDEPKHGVFHYISTQGSPVFARPRKLTPGQTKVARNIINELIEDGIVRPSSSPWSSPIHLVPKPNSEDYRLVGDYRQLNLVTKKDRYTLPYLSDFSQDLYGKKVFSNLDLKNAYHQIPVNPRDIPKTAITTPFGNYEYMFLPFGLISAPSTFQRFIDSIMRKIITKSGREVSLFVYLDDILVASENDDAHKEDLDAVFEQLDRFGLKLNIRKCEFFTQELKFLGYSVSSDGLAPLPSKVRAINEYQKPVTVTDLRRYLGMINFYHTLLPGVAEVLAPLTEMLKCTRVKKK